MSDPLTNLVSKSKWVARIIHDKAGSDWPDSIAQLAGSWPDFPTVEEIRYAIADDVKRELF